MRTKTILLFSFISIFTINAYAQHAYTAISIGYAAGIPAYSLGTSTKTQLSGTTYTLEKGNYGQGLNYGIKGGYMFGKNVGAELGISYLIGSKKEFITSDLHADSSSATVSLTEGTITIDKIKMIRVNPAVKLTLGQEVRSYLRMGIIIGLGTSYTRIDEMVVTTTGSINDTTATEIFTEYSGGTAFGFNSAFGVDIDLTDNLVLYGELFFSSISWAATKSKITSYIVDGVDIVPASDPAELETEYVDDYTEPLTGNSSNRKALKTHLPFGSFGITAGVIYRFGAE